MGTATLNLIQGESRQVPLSVVKSDGSFTDLRKPGTSVLLRVWASISDMSFGATPLITKSSADKTQIAIQLDGTASIYFMPEDTAALSVQSYVYTVQVTSAEDGIVDVVPPNPFNVTLGGITASPTPPFNNTVSVNHDYGLQDALRYMTPDGSPIAEAQVRVYYKSDYDANQLSTPVGITQTDAFGRWKNPVLVLPGFSYVVQFFLPNQYGPDTASIAA